MSETKIRYDWNNAQSCYEAGMLYFTNEERNPDMITKGINLLKHAGRMGSPDAMFMVGKLAWEGYIEIKKGNPKDEALKMLFLASSKGALQAKVMLNEICKERYNEKFGMEKSAERQPGPLTDWDGNKIKIRCKGLRTPIDAKLKYENGKNILTFRANVNVISGDEEQPSAEVRKAVLDGMREWAGEYSVFGGQQLTVVIDVAEKTSLLDTINVFIMDEEIKRMMQQVADAFSVVKGESFAKDINALLESERSFEAQGKEWSMKGRKSIFVRYKQEDDYDAIQAIVKHEFGHALGLGDLYYEKARGFEGVEKGTYEELDAYHISDKMYHLVMCNKHGVISNNDIEMIVLAFSENEMQRYQPTTWNYDVSEALGKGN